MPSAEPTHWLTEAFESIVLGVLVESMRKESTDLRKKYRKRLKPMQRCCCECHRKY
jgi:hypothetical protein